MYRGTPDARVETGRDPYAPPKPVPYVPDADLVEAVNLAIHARRPLLLEGEAGCGKSSLAIAVADELGLPFYRWDVRSSSKAQDGLYVYDALRRLHDNQLRAANPQSPTAGDPARPMDYVTFGALGRAFQRSAEGARAVVLIDEIDKADVDFPNDLLAVLDEPWSFVIPEAEHKAVWAKEDALPIVFVTSNKERGNLPAPFLRRCVYAFVPFPDAQLETIVAAHGLADRPEVAHEAAERLRELRRSKELFKSPGTSEFIDWLRALVDLRPGLELEDLRQPKPIPFPQLLFKMRADYQRHLPKTQPA